MATQAYEETMAARYDRDFQGVFGGPERGDRGFFVRVAAETNGPIVEIGAGTGRVISAVAEACPGRACVGVEPSAGMRKAFADKGGGLVMHAGSFAAIPLADASQGFVFAAFRSFQHLLDVDAQRAALAEMRRVMRPGAVLALDLFDPDPARLVSTGWARSASYGQAGLHVERWERREVARAAQIMTVSFRWIERRRGQVTTSDSGYRVRWTHRFELLHLLTGAGFVDVDIRGDYDGRLVSDEPRELVVTARRRDTA